MRLGVFLVHFFGVVTFFSCHSPFMQVIWKPERKTYLVECPQWHKAKI